jgi:hypothetical protein
MPIEDAIPNPLVCLYSIVAVLRIYLRIVYVYAPSVSADLLQLVIFSRLRRRICRIDILISH